MKTEVKFGDIWKLGNHQLLCGDSSEEAMVNALLKTKKPVLMVTDPPYGVNYTNSKTRRFRNDKNIIDNNEISLSDIKIRNDHRSNWGKAISLSRSRIAYVWGPSTNIDVTTQSLRDANYKVRQSIVWAKNRFALTSHGYHWKHEVCFYSVKEGQTSTWTGDRKQTSLWEESVINPSERIHPTQKPIGLYLRPINNHTEKGDYVYDPFAGSGVLFVACEETGRKALGVELDPEYCSRIINRYQEQTGKKAKLVKNIFEEAQASA